MYFRFPFQTEANALSALAFLICHLRSRSLSPDEAGSCSTLESYGSSGAETFYLSNSGAFYLFFFFPLQGSAKVIESSATLAIAVFPC